jgi:hypothetical protein
MGLAALDSRAPGGAVWRVRRGYLADWPGSPKPANNSVADGVDFRLSFALRFLPMFVWRRTRRFQVERVFEAMTEALLSKEKCGRQTIAVSLAGPATAGAR